MKATTRKKQLKDKSDRMLEIVKGRMTDKAEAVVTKLGAIVPVDTGAYAESMHINPRGDASGIGVSKEGKTRPTKAQKPSHLTTVIDQMMADLSSEVTAIDNIEEGFTVVNNAPHARDVENYVEPVFAQIRNII